MSHMHPISDVCQKDRVSNQFESTTQRLETTENDECHDVSSLFLKQCRFEEMLNYLGYTPLDCVPAELVLLSIEIKTLAANYMTLLSKPLPQISEVAKGTTTAPSTLQADIEGQMVSLLMEFEWDEGTVQPALLLISHGYSPQPATVLPVFSSW